MKNGAVRFFRMFLLCTFVVGLEGLWVSSSLAQNGGQSLFKSKCAVCHGQDGKGETPMGKMLKIRDLGSADVQKQTDAELNQIITKGKNKMPAFEGKLKKEEIEQLVAYVRELGKKH